MVIYIYIYITANAKQEQRKRSEISRENTKMKIIDNRMYSIRLQLYTQCTFFHPTAIILILIFYDFYFHTKEMNILQMKNSIRTTHRKGVHYEQTAKREVTVIFRLPPTAALPTSAHTFAYFELS